MNYSTIQKFTLATILGATLANPVMAQQSTSPQPSPTPLRIFLPKSAYAVPPEPTPVSRPLRIVLPTTTTTAPTTATAPAVPPVASQPKPKTDNCVVLPPLFIKYGSNKPQENYDITGKRFSTTLDMTQNTVLVPRARGTVSMYLSKLKNPNFTRDTIPADDYARIAKGDVRASDILTYGKNNHLPLTFNVESMRNKCKQSIAFTIDYAVNATAAKPTTQTPSVKPQYAAALQEGKSITIDNEAIKITSPEMQQNPTLRGGNLAQGLNLVPGYYRDMFEKSTTPFTTPSYVAPAQEKKIVSVQEKTLSAIVAQPSLPTTRSYNAVVSSTPSYQYRLPRSTLAPNTYIVNESDFHASSPVLPNIEVINVPTPQAAKPAPKIMATPAQSFIRGYFAMRELYDLPTIFEEQRQAISFARTPTIFGTDSFLPMYELPDVNINDALMHGGQQ